MTKVSPMYISPITIMQGEMNVRVENEIIKAVQNIGIDVDKEELIKALAYDRKQYEKGYEDGKAEAMRWIPCSERLPEDDGLYITTKRNPITGRLPAVSMSFFIEGDFQSSRVVAWMPLPEPYKEEEA